MTDPVLGISWPVVMGFEHVWPYLLGALVAGFAVGSIPMGLLIAKALGLPDPRSVGSGNVGATNMVRAGGWKVGLAALLFDALKGWAPAMIAFSYFGPLAAGCAGIGAFLGHCFSPFLGFKGGKGVSTGFGALLAWRWEIGVICLAVWIATAALFRFSSLAALLTTVAAVVLFPYFEKWDYAPFVVVMAAVLIWRHAGNIGRLMRGEEPKIGASAK